MSRGVPTSNLRTEAYCFSCHKEVGITFKHRDMPYMDECNTLRETLVGVCNECDETVTVEREYITGDMGWLPTK